MGGRRRTARLWAGVCTLALVLGLTGCVEQKPAQTKVFAMDTVMELTVYGSQGEDAMNAAVERLYDMEREMSATDPGSGIYRLNDAEGQWTELSPQTADLLARSLELCALTGGALDITAYPAVKAWGFTTGSYRVPSPGQLRQLAARIGYEGVELDGTRARMEPGMAMDLGSVVKGWAGDELAADLEEAGVTSALLDLGQSSIQAIGTKPDGSPWRIGIRDPQSDGYLGVVELDNLAMGTSGGYQRYFKDQETGQTYWHIMDPATAAPARSGVDSVTVVGPSGLVCDALSTALFVMGEEAGAKLWRDHPELNFEAVFIREDGSVALTRGLEQNFELAGAYQDREVQVLP